MIHIGTAQAEAALLAAGGCIASYRLNSGPGEFDLLCPLHMGSGGAADPLATACFPLLPYSSRIKNGHFSFAGESHQLPLNFGDHPHSIHGVGWQSLWQVKEHSDNQAVLELSHDGAGWPFPFYASQTFTLENSTLSHEIAITNQADIAAPAGLGMHPYFLRHGRAELRAAVDAVWLTDETCLPTERVPCPDHWNLSAGADVDGLLCDNQFESWNRHAQILWPDKNMSLELTASEGIERLVVYAPKNEKFFCVEPVSHMTDAFNRAANCDENTGMRILAPGESWNVSMTLSPKPI